MQDKYMSYGMYGQKNASKLLVLNRIPVRCFIECASINFIINWSLLIIIISCMSRSESSIYLIFLC